LKDSRTKIFLAIFLLVPLSFCLSQSTVKIYGDVLDARTGLPLSGANVVVEGTALGTSTDDRGRFVIEDLYVGEYTLSATYIGYETMTLRNVHVGMDQPIRVEFKLEPSSLLMPTVVVKAEKFKDDINVENRVIIDKEDIRRSNAQNVADLLRTVPGVEIKESSGSGSRASVSIRGSQANQVLILIDGVQLSNALTGEIDLSSIPLASVQRIEISKGASTAAQGNGAIAGVMNIITKSYENRKLELKGGVGSFGSRNLSSTFMSHVRDYSFLLVAEKGSSVGNYPYQYRLVDGTGVTRERRNADFNSKQFFTTISRTTRKSHFKLMGLLHRSDRGQPGLLYGLTPYARALTERGIARLFFETQRLGGSLQSNISFLHERTEYSNLYPPNLTGYGIVPPYHNENQLQQIHGKLDWKLAVTESQKLTIGFDCSGLQFRDMELLQQYSPVGEARTTAFGLLLQHEWTFHPKFFNKAAARTTLRYDDAYIRHKNLNHRERFFSPFVGLFLSKQIVLHWQLTANYGRAFRLPTYADLFYQQYRVRGNVNLMPEKSTSREIAIAAWWRMAGKAMLRVSFFENEIKDLIIWRMGSFATFSPINTDAKISGQEIEFNWHPGRKWLDLSIFQTVLHTENLSRERTTHGKELPYRPGYSTKARVQLQIGSAFVHYFVRHIGKRFVTAANTVTMPGYTINDLTFGKSWLWHKKELLLKASVFNLSNENYQIIENAPLPGREWRMALEFRW